MKLYMAVTADRYELPLFVTNSAKEMAQFMQQPIRQVYTLVCPSRSNRFKDNGKNRGYNLVRIEVEDDE